MIARFAMLAVLAVAPWAAAQAPDDRPPPRDRPAPNQPEDKASYRARLERSAADSKRRWERFEAAIKKLDAGATVDDVRRDTELPGMRRPMEGRPKNGDRPSGEPPRGPDGPPPGERLAREDVLAVIESSNAEFASKLKKALADNPNMAGRIIDRMEPMAREIKSERDPEMRELRVKNLTKGFELAGAARSFAESHRADPNSSATKEAATKVRALFLEHFDVRTQMHRQEIVMLERRITQLREELEQQLKDRDSIIERKMEDLKKGFRGRGEREPRREGEPKGDPKRPDR